MNPYDDLSDDDQIAFLQLEHEFRTQFETDMEDGDNWNWYAPDYMSKVLAAARQLNIEALDAYQTPIGNTLDGGVFSTFMRDVDYIKVQIRIMSSRRVGKMKVGFTAEQKTKLHGYIERMRQEIQQSETNENKKDAIYKILANLNDEISKDRTKYERLADLARSLAGLSKEVEREGAQPWWKWFKLMAGVVDDAKENEPKLPPVQETKRIEAPRKELPKPMDSGGHNSNKSGGNESELDDEIPF